MFTSRLYLSSDDTSFLYDACEINTVIIELFVVKLKLLHLNMPLRHLIYTNMYLLFDSNKIYTI